MCETNKNISQWVPLGGNDQEKIYREDLNNEENKLLKDDNVSNTEKELILKNQNFVKDLELLELNFGGNMIKNKPILSKNNISYFCTEKNIICLNLKKKKKKIIVTSFSIDRIFYFYDKKYEEEYLILKGFDNYIYVYQITNNTFQFVKKFIINNLFYINSFGKNGELCLATWEYVEKKLYANFFLLRFSFNYENSFYNFDKKNDNNQQNDEQVDDSIPTHITYNYESGFENECDISTYPIELSIIHDDEYESEYFSKNNYYNTNFKRPTKEKKKKKVITTKLILKPILKIKYIFFSMIDMDKNLSKLILANNNLIIIYDLTKSWYNIIYYNNYISTIKISDDDKSLCVGFFNGYIYILNFGEIMPINYEQNQNKHESLKNNHNMFQKMDSQNLLNNIKEFSRMFPYIPVFEADYISNDTLKIQSNDQECDNELKNIGNDNDFVKNIPYINLGGFLKNMINKQRVHCTKYKWHSHSVYNIITEKNKIISTGEEAVILIYNKNDASFEFISHLGSPCYYIYLNTQKNIIICNSLNNSMFFINYNKRLFFYKYNGLSMPLKLTRLFYNNLDMIINIKKSFCIFGDQLFGKFNYYGKPKNKKNAIQINNLNILNDEKINHDYMSEIEENDSPQNNNIDNKEVDDSYNYSENENNEMTKKSIITFESIQNELEKSIYNNANIENSLYQNFQLSYFCGSNDGLICCFLTSFAHLQLYNVEKNKHIKNICPLNIIYKSRTDSEKVNDIELNLYAINNTRNIIMTIEKRNYYMYGVLDTINQDLIHTTYTIRFWIHIKNFDYFDMFQYTINKEPEDFSNIIGNNKDGEEFQMDENDKTQSDANQNNSKINTNNIEKYKKIIPHPALSLFILLGSDGNITYWCLEKSDKILGDDVYKNFEIESYEMDSVHLAYVMKNTENETDIYANNTNNNDDVENNTAKDKLNNEEEGETYNIITVVKNINYKNTPILNGDISKDGGILCICHDTLISIWDCINLKTLAIINHPMYTLLNDYIFNLYKGIEIFDVENNIYMCYYSFDTLFIYSLNQFHLVHEKKFNGIIEYVKFDKHSSKMLAVGITKRIKNSNDQKINEHHYDNTCLVQKNYLYKFSQNYLKKKKKFYLSQNKPIIAIEFAPINKEQSVTLSNYQDEAIIIALNSKFQICTFYFNNYPKHAQLR
ncbi:conserved Plasmodium protein, unknown function [Plasmodium berghei]|uniref:WD repeat-containing protein, putative n=2 Tax=Plasmodium berghei TaxID=5821 RepID=A0A509AJV6_PLABA|nr:WD repeat-containing protein, putative [Plasmodium berghei ANKA]CXI42939.1 conserved Plasmodium protein, unknown function [Plasmodium berghei]SCM22216.1 conserved Plasmodium protein, unknown function [Plasmodium berghei]SCN25339.1 conserved Plasmodium protein, unknown function [Plasmodium berghei]SCO60311.1 conserved Plasmodium protein, unknown function [Plasmodium berghei]SCO62011.1 conserved Plasmodium protein, unknown function [Plasmodium berghei]|eukprot:XP_034421569.1 WD repeat-containing protein, putative [Plasmodium berghei ANKA]